MDKIISIDSLFNYLLAREIIKIHMDEKCTSCKCKFYIVLVSFLPLFITHNLNLINPAVWTIEWEQCLSLPLFLGFHNILESKSFSAGRNLRDHLIEYTNF